jgi:hypothetical protein
MQDEKVPFAVLIDNFENAAIELNKYWPGQYRHADQIADSLRREAVRWIAIQNQVRRNREIVAG